MQRIIYALPKIKGKTARGAQTAEEEKQNCLNIYYEIEDQRKRKFDWITSWRCKPVSRKYAFELPLQHGEHKFLKIKYDAKMDPLPANLTGSTFECLFGVNQSMLELFIIKQKIMGPCWLTIQGASKVAS